MQLFDKIIGRDYGVSELQGFLEVAPQLTTALPEGSPRVMFQEFLTGLGAQNPIIPQDGRQIKYIRTLLLDSCIALSGVKPIMAPKPGRGILRTGRSLGRAAADTAVPRTAPVRTPAPAPTEQIRRVIQSGDMCTWLKRGLQLYVDMDLSEEDQGELKIGLTQLQTRNPRYSSKIEEFKKAFPLSQQNRTNVLQLVQRLCDIPHDPRSAMTVARGKPETKLRDEDVKLFLAEGGLATAETFGIAKWWENQRKLNYTPRKIKELLENTVSFQLSPEDVRKFNSHSWRNKEHRGDPNEAKRRLREGEEEIRKIEDGMGYSKRLLASSHASSRKLGQNKLQQSRAKIERRRQEMQHDRAYLDTLQRGPQLTIEAAPEKEVEVRVSPAEAARRHRKKRKVKFSPTEEISDPTAPGTEELLETRAEKRAKTEAETEERARLAAERKRMQEWVPTFAPGDEPFTIREFGLTPYVDREAARREWLSSEDAMRFNPAAKSLQGWEDQLEDARKDRTKLYAKFYEIKEKWDKKYHDHKQLIRSKSSIREYTKWIGKIIESGGVVSQAMANKWKRKIAKPFLDYYNIKVDDWKTYKYKISKPYWLKDLKELRTKIMNSPGAVELEINDITLMSRVAGMPIEAIDKFKATREKIMERYGVMKNEYERLFEDVERFKQVVEDKKQLNEQAEMNRKEQERKERKRRKKEARRQTKEIKVKSKQLKRRGREKEVEAETKRARTQSPPKGRTKTKKSADRDSGPKRSRKAPIISAAEVVKERHRIGRSGARQTQMGKLPHTLHAPDDPRLSLSKENQPKKKPRTGGRKPSVASGPSPFMGQD